MNTPATKNLRINPARVVVWLQMTLFTIGLVAYLYFILLSVIQIVLRQELMVSIQEAETTISELESTYFAYADMLTPQTAEQYGLVAVEPSAYVTVTPTGNRLTRND
jgi:hypothetical protein